MNRYTLKMYIYTPLLSGAEAECENNWVWLFGDNVSISFLYTL